MARTFVEMVPFMLFLEKSLLGEDRERRGGAGRGALLARHDQGGGEEGGDGPGAGRSLTNVQYCWDLANILGDGPSEFVAIEAVWQGGDGQS